MNPKLIVEQKITAFVNRYAVYGVGADGSKGQMVAFAQQKRLKIKEKILVYTDESKTQLAFTLRAEKVFDVHGKYLVEDANGNLLGAFRKDFAKSLVNSTWHVLDSDGNDWLTVTESSAAIAALRRFIGFIPIVGEFADFVMLFFKYHFSFLENGTQVGMYRKTTLFRDHYTLSFTDEAYAKNDWRLLVAVAVALDALQSR